GQCEQAPEIGLAKSGRLGELRPHLPPDFRAITLRPIRNRQRLDGRQDPLKGLVIRPARFAAFEVLRDLVTARSLPVMVEDELIFVQVVHGIAFNTGSSARRIFCTARKMLCLVALGPVPRARPISSIDRPSKWRSTNAVRSIGVSCSITASTFCRTSK